MFWFTLVEQIIKFNNLMQFECSFLEYPFNVIKFDIMQTAH